MRSICCLALALALPLNPAAAQERPALAPGARVRVTTPDSTVVGILESVDSASIVVRRQDGTAADLPRARGTHVDVSAGPGTCSPDRRGTCVVVGFVSGVALGIGVGAIAASTCDFCADRINAIALPAGAVFGTIVGAVIGGEHWNRAELPARLSWAPGVPGVRVGVSLTF